MRAKSVSLLLPLLVSVTACQPAPSDRSLLLDSDAPLPPVRTVLECLPKEAALVAAHRATAAGLNNPENSISSLEALIDHGTLMAEVDVAALRDGTPIIFHDGVWDDDASATGPVVATTPQDFAPLRLKDKKGQVGGEPVPTLAAMLDAAKDRIYLELDLKSSANLETVISLVRDRDMADQVLLIASDETEASEFMAYSEEFLLSLPSARKRTNQQPRQGVWVGEGWREGDEKAIESRHYVIGAQWQKNPAQLAKASQALDILVTRQALRYAPIEGLRKTAAFRNCIVNSQRVDD